MGFAWGFVVKAVRIKKNASEICNTGPKKGQNVTHSYCPSRRSRRLNFALQARLHGSTVA